MRRNAFAAIVFGRQRMPISNKEVTLMRVLQFDPVFSDALVLAEV